MSHRPHDAPSSPPRARPVVSCERPDARVDARLHELLDGELPADAADALHAHLVACPPCRSRAAALGRFVAALRRQRMRQPTAPVALRARVDALLDTLTEAPTPAALLAGVTRGLPEHG